MLLTSAAKGVFPIAPTPFLDDGTIDTASLDRLGDFTGRGWRAQIVVEIDVRNTFELDFLFVVRQIEQLIGRALGLRQLLCALLLDDDRLVLDAYLTA